MKSINPYLMFNGNAKDAFQFYQSVLGGELSLIRYSDMPDMENAKKEDLEKAAHIALPINGSDHILMASDAPSANEVELGSNSRYHITLVPESTEEADRVFQGLSQGGQVMMPLEKTDWAEKFAMFTDKFGVQWMINYEG